MKKRLIIANWKMYPTLSDSLVLAGSIKRGVENLTNVDVVISPPLAWLLPVMESTKAWPQAIKFGAQNIWPDDQGAFTGEVSAYMLKNIVSYAIVGHSERREYQQEDNSLINEKVQACLKWRITPVLCVGEKKEVDIPRTQGQPNVTQLANQIMEGVEGVSQENLHKVVIAYEPIWAIGRSDTASPDYVVHIINALKYKLSQKYPRSVVDEVRFLYGGGENQESAPKFFQREEIDGLLVGHNSIKAKEIIKICKDAATIQPR